MAKQASRRAAREPEYRLFVSRILAERTQKFMTQIILETTKSFATFQYELSIEERLEGKTLSLTILGFNTPKLSLPSAGPARFAREYEEWKGTHHVLIQGIDGRSNEFTFRASSKKLDLVKSPHQSFVQVYTNPTTWSQRPSL
jgi:hypothetical protein